MSEHGRCLLDFGVDFGRILIPSACIRIRPKNTYRRLQNLGFPKRDISRRRVPLGACIKEGVRVDLSNACFLGLRESLLSHPKPGGERAGNGILRRGMGGERAVNGCVAQGPARGRRPFGGAGFDFSTPCFQNSYRFPDASGHLTLCIQRHILSLYNLSRMLARSCRPQPA